MARTKRDDLRSLDEQKLFARLKECRAALQKVRFGLSGAPTRAAAERRKLRRQIARVLTELRRRELARSGGSPSRN